mgnify:CR=1 FL=1
MSDYLFIQSQDPFTETRAGHQYRLAQQLREAGHGGTVLLVQNGVVPARQEAPSRPFASLLKAGVKLADEFSLRQREINDEQLKAGIAVCDMGAAIDAMLASHKVIWH